ncbi:helix-turn-helix domain-containing protein, partial [Xanthomonas citri]|uniref:helix-turn-helix domain-containing protein n=1 Tax=Xanthomonas citri TaxID=346 RepID=UPI00131E15F5
YGHQTDMPHHHHARRLQRFLRIVRGHRNLTEAALHAGYGDAPHLVRDARQLTGLSPRALVQQHAR